MNKTELQKDVLQIAQMVKNDGIEERVHSAQTSWLTWTDSNKETKRRVFNLDLNKNNAINPIIFGRLTDGNLRKITVNITNEGEPIDLSGYKVTFEGISGGKTKVFDSLGVNLLDAQNGKFEYKFSKVAFSSTGKFKTAYFSIEKDGTRETTNDIQIMVNTVADVTAQDAEVAITELNKTITLMEKAGFNTWEHTNQSQINYLKKLAQLV